MLRNKLVFLFALTLAVSACSKDEEEPNQGGGAAPAPSNIKEVIRVTPQGLAFDDANLERCMMDMGADRNDDGVIQLEEAKKVTRLNCRGYLIRSLRGVRHLENLETVSCSGNYLDALPEFSRLKNLKKLRCTNNYLTDRDCDEVARLRKNGVQLEVLTQRDGLQLTCDKVALMGRVPNKRPDVNLHDVWGFKHEGKNYAVYGDTTYVHIVEVTEREPYFKPTASMPRGKDVEEEVAEEKDGKPVLDKDGKPVMKKVTKNFDQPYSHPNHSIWGEHRYFRKGGKAYLFSSSEGSRFKQCVGAKDKDGKKIEYTSRDLPRLQIFDVTDIKNPVEIDLGDDIHPGLHSIHNITVDEDRGLLIALGGSKHWEKCNKYGYADSFAGARFYSLENPADPQYVTTVGKYYVHDAQIKTRTNEFKKVVWSRIYLAEGTTAIHWDANEQTNEENRLGIYDVLNLKKPVELLDQQYPYGYAHNIWATEDDSHIIVTGETSVDNQLSFWKLVGEGDGKLRAEFVDGENLQGGALAHNAFVHGNHIYTSHYTKGVQVFEICLECSGSKMVQLKWSYDTYPRDNSGEMEGAWGVYPFGELQDFFYVTDQVTGFHIFKKSPKFRQEEGK